MALIAVVVAMMSSKSARRLYNNANFPGQANVS